MTLVNKLKFFTAALGTLAVFASAFVWGEPSTSKTTLGGLNPTGVKLRDDLMSNRFAKQPVVAYHTAEDETVFALQLKPSLKQFADTRSAPERDLVILVDTSASQAGKFLDASRKIVERLIKHGEQVMVNDRISVWTVNTPKATRRLTKGLDYAKNLARVSSSSGPLAGEYPSGAVDLKNGINKALSDFDGKISRRQAINSGLRPDHSKCIPNRKVYPHDRLATV
jgi:hypothetical protein